MKVEHQTGFYVVWCPQSGAPTKRHTTARSAEAEAERLAAQSPGKEFYVLCAEMLFRRTDVERIRLIPEIPF